MQIKRVPRHHNSGHNPQGRQHVIGSPRHFPKHSDQIHAYGTTGRHAKPHHGPVQHKQHTARCRRGPHRNSQPAQQSVDAHSKNGDMQGRDTQNMQDTAASVEILQFPVQPFLFPQKQSPHKSRLPGRENLHQPFPEVKFQAKQSLPDVPVFLSHLQKRSFFQPAPYFQRPVVSLLVKLPGAAGLRKRRKSPFHHHQSTQRNLRRTLHLTDKIVLP